MVKKVCVSIPDWLYTTIETNRGKTNRSEYVTEKIIKGLGVNQ